MNMKKVLALALAAVMVMALCGSAFALSGDQQQDNTWTGTADGLISISGLGNTDTVDFYQVLEATDEVDNATNLIEGGWKVTSQFATGTGALDATDLHAILTTGINSALADKITQKASSATYSGITVSSNTATKTGAAPGLYLALVTPGSGTTATVYNPVFVAADYYTTTGGDLSSTWDVDTDLSYADQAVAKKTVITVEKTAAEDSEAANETNGAMAVGTGDVIDFTITTTIPKYGDNYVNPVFKVSDQMSTGLALVSGSIKVYKSADFDAFGDTDVLESTDTYVTTPSGTTAFEVAFNSDYIKALTAALPITITYQATVTDTAPLCVNEEDNTVTVSYSNNPSDTTGAGKLYDKTHHYVFAIDGSIWGDSGWELVELVKIGLDQDGNEITDTVTLENGSHVGALAGAEFKLFTDAACTTEYNKGPYASASATASGNKIVSDTDGRLNFNGESLGIHGLDAGTYYLKEMKAPAGYIKYDSAVKIEIIPEFYPEYEFTEDGKTYKCDDVLKSYKIEIDDQEVANYTLNYTMAGTTPDHPVNDTPVKDSNNNYMTHGDIVIGNHGPYENRTTDTQADDGKIPNTQGLQLPSTGGIGTTIFYVSGLIMVLGAAVILVARRRADAE